jgi:S1-C subfamily serine protease
VGDWLLTLDGKPTASVDSLIALLGESQIGVPMRFELVRGRERSSLAVTPESDG